VSVIHTYSQRIYASGKCAHNHQAVALMVERILAASNVTYEIRGPLGARAAPVG
jgi:hypothetical protein